MPVVVTGWSSSVPAPRNQLVAKVAGLYGIESGNDSELAGKALEWLDESVTDLNMALFEYNKVSETGIALVSGTQSYTIAAQFYRESQARLVHNTQGDCTPLTYLNWVTFKRLYPGTSTGDKGMPSTYTSFNAEALGTIQLYPIPNDSTVTNYTLTLE